MTQGMNDEFERLIQRDPELACQLQNMTQERIRDIRSLTFGNPDARRIDDTQIFQYGLDYFASIANGQSKDQIIRDVRQFAEGRGVSFNEEGLKVEIDYLSALSKTDGFRKKLDDASRAVGSSKECHFVEMPKARFAGLGL